MSKGSEGAQSFQTAQRPGERVLDAMERDLWFVGMTYHRFFVYHQVD